MCIRDSLGDRPTHPELLDWLASEFMAGGWRMKQMHRLMICLLYTSDAADERSSVDLGGRRIIKKKNRHNIRQRDYLTT